MGDVSNLVPFPRKDHFSQPISTTVAFLGQHVRVDVERDVG